MEPGVLLAAVTLLVGVVELRVAAVAAPALEAPAEVILGHGRIPFAALGVGHALQFVVHDGEDDLGVAGTQIHGEILGIGGGEAVRAVLDDVLRELEGLVIGLHTGVHFRIEVHTHQQHLDAPVIQGAVGLLLGDGAGVDDLGQFLDDELVHLLPGALRGHFRGELGHDRDIAVLVQQQGVPEGAKGAKLRDVPGTGILGDRDVSGLDLGEDPVAEVDGLERGFIRVRGLPFFIGPGMTVHALVGAAVIPTVGTGRRDDHVRRFLLGVEQSLPTQNVREVAVAAGNHGGELIVTEFDVLGDDLGESLLLQVETCREQHGGGGQNTYCSKFYRFHDGLR